MVEFKKEKKFKIKTATGLGVSKSGKDLQIPLIKEVTYQGSKNLNNSGFNNYRQKLANVGDYVVIENMSSYIKKNYLGKIIKINKVENSPGIKKIADVEINDKIAQVSLFELFILTKEQYLEAKHLLDNKIDLTSFEKQESKPEPKSKPKQKITKVNDIGLNL